MKAENIKPGDRVNIRKPGGGTIGRTVLRTGDGFVVILFLGQELRVAEHHITSCSPPR